MKQAKISISLFVFLFLTLGFGSLLPAQPGTMEQIPRQLESYQHALNPQKLFIHFDKEHYAAGETIWLKGYLVQASDHSPVLDTANVYLELWNTRGEKVRELIFQPKDGHFFGQIFLDPEIPDGNYVVRAYSDWMLNQDESFLFNKYFYVSNPSFANQIDNDTRKLNREFNEALQESRDENAIEFYPEGGSLVEGLESRVAIRVSDLTGRGIMVKGQIKDQEGRLVAGFETNASGIGLFTLRPEAGKRYFAEIPSGGRQTLAEPLPQALRDGFVLKADLLEEEIEVNISGTRELGNASLLVQSKGETVFFEQIQGRERNAAFKIPLSAFPNGIAQVVFFGADANPLAERLVFVNQDDQVYFDMQARILRSDEETALSIDVMASDEEGKPMAGNYSVAVQYGEVGERTRYENIFSNLFLGSDLGERVEEPAQYFDYSQEDIDSMVDMLLMTKGYQRFSWPEVLGGGVPEISFKPSYGIDVSGSLSGKKDQVGVANVEVKLRVVQDPAQTFLTQTNTEGKFVFRGLPLVDDTMVEIIAPMIAGRQLPEVSLDTTGRADPGILPMEYVANVNTLMQQITERGDDWSRPRESRRGTQPARGGQLYGTPDQTIYINDNEPYSAILDVLRDKAIGLSISPTGFITIRGVTSINYQNPPLFIVDGVESEGAFLSLHPRDVERIEIFKGASTAAFGARGASGALVAYTKRRDFQDELLVSGKFVVNGLHKGLEFFAEPEVPASFDDINPVKTLFWEPLLKSGEDGVARFQFRPVPGVTQYRIIIQGVGENGKVGYAEFILGN